MEVVDVGDEAVVPLVYGDGVRAHQSMLRGPAAVERSASGVFTSRNDSTLRRPIMAPVVSRSKMRGVGDEAPRPRVCGGVGSWIISTTAANVTVFNGHVAYGEPARTCSQVTTLPGRPAGSVTSSVRADSGVSNTDAATSFDLRSGLALMSGFDLSSGFDLRSGFDLISGLALISGFDLTSGLALRSGSP